MSEQYNYIVDVIYYCQDETCHDRCLYQASNPAEVIRFVTRDFVSEDMIEDIHIIMVGDVPLMLSEETFDKIKKSSYNLV